MITGRLPASQYESSQERKMARNASLPNIEESKLLPYQPAQQVKLGMRGGSLAPIQEREELRSARVTRTKYDDIIKQS